MKLLPTFATASGPPLNRLFSFNHHRHRGTQADCDDFPPKSLRFWQKAKISKACSEQADARNLNGRQPKRSVAANAFEVVADRF